MNNLRAFACTHTQSHEDVLYVPQLLPSMTQSTFINFWMMLNFCCCRRTSSSALAAWVCVCAFRFCLILLFLFSVASRLRGSVCVCQSVELGTVIAKSLNIFHIFKIVSRQVLNWYFVRLSAFLLLLHLVNGMI